MSDRDRDSLSRVSSLSANHCGVKTVREFDNIVLKTSIVSCNCKQFVLSAHKGTTKNAHMQAFGQKNDGFSILRGKRSDKQQPFQDIN